MGAYSNPETYVDTESGRYIAESIAGFGKNVAEGIQLREKRKLEEAKLIRDTYEKKQKALEEDTKKAQQDKENFINKGEPVLKLPVGGIFRAPLYESANKVAELSLKSEQLTGEAKLQSMNKRLQYNASIPNITGGLENLQSISEYRKKNTNPAGELGGVSVAFNDDNTLYGLMAINGDIPGADLSHYSNPDDPSDNGIISKGVINGKSFEYTANFNALKTSLDAHNPAGPLKYIPNPADKIKAMQNILPDIFEVDDKGISTGKIKNEYLLKPVVKETRTTSVNKKTGATTQEQTFVSPVNQEAILKNQHVRDLLVAQAKEYLVNTNDAKMLYYEGMRSDRHNWKGSGWSLEDIQKNKDTVLDENKFVNDYVNWAVKGFFPNEQDVENPKSNVATTKYTPGKGSGNGGEEDGDGIPKVTETTTITRTYKTEAEKEKLRNELKKYGGASIPGYFFEKGLWFNDSKPAAPGLKSETLFKILTRTKEEGKTTVTTKTKK